MNLDINLARRLVQYAKRAYADNPCAAKIGASCTVFYSPLTDAEFFVEYVGDNLILTFRGSQSAEDFEQDGRFIRTDVDGLGIHKGFWQDISSVDGKIFSIIKDAGKPVIFTGHSLGADLALLAAWLCARQNLPVLSVYAFAPARPGNAAFRDNYNKLLYDRTFCFENRDDPVPQIPFLFMGARRVGQLVYLTSPGHFKINPPTWFIAKKNIFGAFSAWRQGRKALFPNHKIDKYITNLAA